MADPIHLYATEDHRLPRRLIGKLKIEHEKAFSEVVYAQDWADFAARRAKVFALKRAIDLCEETEKELGL